MPSNVEDVIGDIEDVKDDLHDNMENAGRSSMGRVLFDALGYIKKDADWRGLLAKSMSLSVDDDGTELTFNVHTDAEIAPYAPFVEFGTGRKTDRPSPWSVYPVGWPDTGSAVPVDYPYPSPEMGPGLVANIIEWVETKPVIPQNDDMTERQLGAVIAAQIANEGTYAHPFMRPAWFDNELIVKSAMKTAVRKSFR